MKRLLLALTGISAMLLGSCSQEMGGGDIDEKPIAANTLRLSVDVDNRPGHSASTRATVAASNDEKTISDLYLLFFEPSADKSGKFVDYVKVDVDSNVSAGVDGITKDIDMSDTRLNVTAAYNILAIANIENFTSDAVRYLGGDADDPDEAETNTAAWMQQWGDKTEAQVIEEAQAITVAAGAVGSKELLMSGITSKEANVFKVEVKLLRNQIRLDVVNRAAGYTLVDVSVWNAYGISKIWNDGSNEGALDYGQSVSRIRGAYYDYTGTFEPVYDDENQQIGEKIENHFYVFENVVSSPVQNDAFTTCIVVGLQPAGGGPTEFYRVNILPENQGQILYRNHAYVLTINSVIGEGRADRTDAYRNANDPELNYIINKWNENEVGASDQDNNSMLSSPYKTVNLDLTTGEIRGRSDRGLDPDRFVITTVTSLPSESVTDLEIIGTPKFYLNGNDPYPYNGDGASLIDEGINVYLDMAQRELVFSPLSTIGEQVTITPTDGGAEYVHTLTAEDRITGTITLGYAGLRIDIDVVQTDITPDVLNVYPPSGGIGTFAPFADIESEPLRVEASGPWTAKILSENPGAFVFADADVDVDGTIKRDPSVTGYNNELTVKTASNNNDSNRARVAFILVSLDSDPNNFARAIQVTQAQKANIAITPAHTAVTFDGTYSDEVNATTGLHGALAAVANNDRTQFSVMPGTSGDPEQGNEVQNEWEYRIEVWNGNTGGPTGSGDWDDVFWESAGDGHSQGVVSGEEGRQWFDIEAVHNTVIGQSNTFSVDVTDKNSTGSTRYARIVVFIKNNPNAAMAYINLVQQSSGMTLSPSIVPAVAKTGGTSAEVGVDSDGSLTWKIESITPTYAVSGRSGVTEAVNHTIEVLNGDTVIASVNGNDVEIENLPPYPVNEMFKVRFPKILYPNRQIGMSVTLKIKLCEEDGTETELTKDITFTQTALTSPGFYPYAPQLGGYGNIHGGAANHRYVIVLRENQTAAPSTSLTVNSNYMHMNYEGLSENYDWAAVKTFRSQRDGLLIVVNDLDYFPHLNMTNNTSSVLGALGYTLAAANGNDAYHNAGIPSTGSDTKVYRMIIEGAGGGTDYSGTMNQPLTNMWVDDVSTCVTDMPPSAVPLITGNTNQQVLMTVDPKNNLIYQGESQVFDTLQGDWLLRSLMVYIKNAAMWGSAFTDLMVEDDQLTVAEEKAGVTVGNHPAPWDEDVWGANAGIQR